MFLAETAVLLRFHTIRMIFLLLGRVVIPLLALCACQRDTSTHNFHLASFNNYIRTMTQQLLKAAVRAYWYPISIRPTSISRKKILVKYQNLFVLPQKQGPLLMLQFSQELLHPAMFCRKYMFRCSLERDHALVHEDDSV